jgi:hypothetical protein
MRVEQALLVVSHYLVPLPNITLVLGMFAACG